MSKTDLQLKQDIEDELRWDPMVNAAQIGVSVDQGAISLLGTVDTYVEKWAAQDAVRRVSGAHSIALDLTVKILSAHVSSDSEIAAAVQRAFKWNVLVPSDVTAEVSKGAVTLCGKVAGNYQREAAERAVRSLAGVVAVYNEIGLEPYTSVAQLKEKVQAALQRQATTDAKAIHIEIAGGKVTLSGSASCWQLIDDASRAAWAAPGVTEVINHMTVARTP